MELSDFLLHLCQSEAQERAARLTQRLLKASGLPPDKTFATPKRKQPAGQSAATTTRSARRALRAAGGNVLAFGLPGRGKTHFVAALGREILRHDCPVLFIPVYKLVSQLLAAKGLNLLVQANQVTRKKYKIVTLDDLGYVQQTREEMEVLFTFLAERYEHWSVHRHFQSRLQPMGQNLQRSNDHHGRRRPPGPHSVILEFDGPSQRCAVPPKKEGPA